MGLEDDESKGVKSKDITKILKGHVKDGYTVSLWIIRNILFSTK